MSKIAREFLTRCFAAHETIAILLRRENPAKTQQRLVHLKQVLGPRYLGWLAHENDLGANIYVSANPLSPRSRKRTKESIASVRHLYIDIDTDGDSRIAALRASDSVPTPTAILSTSPAKYQVLWRVEGFSLEQQELTLKLLVTGFGGDPACTDCNRVLRIPGFLNQKYDPPFQVTAQYPCDSTWLPQAFQIDIGGADASLFASTARAHQHQGARSKSENDWAWVSTQLVNGRDAIKLTRELASRRADKPNPLYYAQRTVDIASARLWLLEGIHIDTVITMLESRRRFEIPTAFCSARAREIAAAAQRRMAR